MTRDESPRACCATCGEWTTDILDHVRLMHPDVWEGIEKWPDGGIVVNPAIEDTTDSDEAHECVFIEEEEPSGRLILPPCIVCGLPAIQALVQVKAQHDIGSEIAEHLRVVVQTLKDMGHVTPDEDAALLRWEEAKR